MPWNMWSLWKKHNGKYPRRLREIPEGGFLLRIFREKLGILSSKEVTKMDAYTPRQVPAYPTPVSPEAVRDIFRDAADLSWREIRAGDHVLTAFFIDGLCASGAISEYVIEPVAENSWEGSQEQVFRQCLEGKIYNAVAKPCEDMDALCQFLVNGFCVVVFPELQKAAAFETRTPEKRNPSPPEVENTVKGAKDAFTETVRTNTSLIRRHLRTPELQVWETVVGRRSLTNVSVLSVRGLTDPNLVQMVKRRLDKIDVDGFLSPAAVEEYLTGSRKTAFPLLQYTERTDRFCQGLLDGQVGVLVDGLPLGYLAPVDVGQLLTGAEDRGGSAMVCSAMRLVRYAALLVALLLPALYVAMARFHPAMIPTKLLRAIIESKQNVPFPAAVEVVGLLIAFELLQEAGLHLPQSIGHTVSIIGGLVVGTAAVEASLISPAALIVVSVAGICGFAVPGKDFSDAVRLWRFALTLASSVAGLFGLSVGVVCLMIHLGSIESCGRPYLAPFSAASGRDAILRRRLVTRKFRPEAFGATDQRNQR